MKISKDHIIKYLKGELTHNQEYELEKMMLEDPFLADAIEGLQEIKDPVQLEDTLEEIEGQLETTYGKPRSLTPLYRNPWAIAAVITLLFVSTAVFFFSPDYQDKLLSLITKEDTMDQSGVPQTANETEQNKQDKSVLSLDTALLPAGEEDEEIRSEEIIDNQSAGQEEPRAMPAAELSAESTEILLTEISDSMVMEQLLAEQDTFPEGKIPGDSLDLIALTSNAPDTSGVTGIFAMKELSKTEPQISDEPDRAIDIEAAAKRAAGQEVTRGAPLSLKTISGQVLSAGDNQPIPGVNVIVRGTSRGTITDASGNYMLQLQPEEMTVDFLFIGFEPMMLRVQESGTYDIRLQTDVTQLSEVVVVGYGITGQGVEESDRFATPIIGRTAYNRYLRDNVAYPEESAQNNIKGRVVLEFTVSVDGTISDLKVTKSLGFGCDEEALRLVREGPAWQPALRNGTPTEEQVRVAVRFKP